jgi:hypothetical protein
LVAVACFLPGRATDLSATPRINKTGNVRNVYNIQARSCNHCYSRKAKSVTQPVCVFVASVISMQMRIRHIAICGLSGSIIFSHIIS